MIQIKFKRGDTFLFRGTVTVGGVAQNISAWTITSHIRSGQVLVAAPTIVKTNPSVGVYTLEVLATATTLWPAKSLVWDIQYTTDSSQVVSTETVEIQCTEDVTRG